MSKTVVCTLFEGHYHHGVAALTNSLYANEFRGDIYAGYKGELPLWASNSFINYDLNWKGASTFNVTDDLNIHFLPLNTHYHLTNYKPNFMLEVWNGVAKNAEGMFYFDPDIIIKCSWNYFEEWIGFGVALVHEISSNDMPPNHPLRKKWEFVINKAKKIVTNQLFSYINGGFCGVHKNNEIFLHDWIDITNTGMKYFGLTASQFKHNYNRTNLFYAQDQDALNITAMSSNAPISEMGPEAMGFIHGGFTMSHAIASPKPWIKNFLYYFSIGFIPTQADKDYWINTKFPIKTFSQIKITIKIISIKIASFLGRFYQRK
jgi:hypothetical protein